MSEELIAICDCYSLLSWLVSTMSTSATGTCTSDGGFSVSEELIAICDCYSLLSWLVSTMSTSATGTCTSDGGFSVSEELIAICDCYFLSSGVRMTFPSYRTLCLSSVLVDSNNANLPGGREGLRFFHSKS